MSKISCPICGGSGEIKTAKCDHCTGAGEIFKTIGRDEEHQKEIMLKTITNLKKKEGEYQKLIKDMGDALDKRMISRERAFRIVGLLNACYKSLKEGRQDFPDQLRNISLGDMWQAIVVYNLLEPEKISWTSGDAFPAYVYSQLHTHGCS